MKRAKKEYWQWPLAKPYCSLKKSILMQLLATVNLLNAGHQRFSYLLPCQEVCNCIYHSNFMLVLDCLHNNLDEIFPLYCENFMKDTVCDIENRQSMTSNHVLCKDKLICVFMTYHQQNYETLFHGITGKATALVN